VLRKPLAAFVLRTVGEEDSLWWGIDCIMPVPLFPEKKKRRGYNQALELARELSARKDIDLVEGGLIKIKSTPAQTSLEASERRQNLKGAFTVTNGHKIEGKTILLVDDVLTTGSTLEECSSVLIEAGASEVRALTVAQA
jgi:competence protein ComFC